MEAAGDNGDDDGDDGDKCKTDPIKEPGTLGGVEDCDGGGGGVDGESCGETAAWDNWYFSAALPASLRELSLKFVKQGREGGGEAEPEDDSDKSGGNGDRGGEGDDTGDTCLPTPSVDSMPWPQVPSEKLPT